MNDTNTAFEGARTIGVLVGTLVGLVIILIPAIFYLLSLQKALNRCSPESRAMQPGMVWLMFIPLFNLVWHFFVVLNIAKSLEAEFRKRGMAVEPNPGKTIGLVMCILGACGIIPILGILCSLGAFVCWIMYWIKIAGFSAKLVAPPGAPA
jgi:hypothetical protein